MEVIKIERMLILTKNVLLEQRIQKDAQELGYEVFVSNSMLVSFIKGDYPTKIFKYFRWLIFSESLDNAEISLIMKGIAKKSKQVALPIMIRKDSSEPTEETKRFMDTLGIENWISSSQSLAELRDLIEKSKNINVIDFQVTDSSASELPNQWEEARLGFLNHLNSIMTNQERVLFEYLIEGKDIITTRLTISRIIWPNSDHKKKEAQLSIIIRNLKSKIFSCGYKKPTIKTIPKRGYILDKDFYNFLRQK